MNTKVDNASVRTKLLELAGKDPSAAAAELNQFAKAVTSLRSPEGEVVRDVFTAMTKAGFGRASFLQYADVAKFMTESKPAPQAHPFETETAIASLKYPRLSPGKPIEQQLGTFIRANAGEDRYLPEIDGGNCGTHAYILEGAAADNFVRFAAHGDYRYKGQAPSYDSAKCVVVGVVATDDEPQVKCLVLDKATFRPVFAEDCNPFDMELAEATPDVIKADPRIAADEDIDGFKVIGVMMLAGKEIPLGHENEKDHGWTIDSYLD